MPCCSSTSGPPREHVSDDCLFCKIVDRKIPAEIIAENEDMIVIKDIAPKAPIHYLIIPKKHFKDVASLNGIGAHVAGKCIAMASELAKKLSGSQSFRLVTNNGEDAGQSVFHLHFHFLSGKKWLDL